MEKMPINEEERPGEENLIKDVSKAFAMASAEDPMMEKATIARQLGLDDQVYIGVAHDEGRRAGEKYEEKGAALKRVIDNMLKDALSQEGKLDSFRVGPRSEFSADELEQALNLRIGESLKNKFQVGRSDDSNTGISEIRVSYVAI